jgi:polyphosphate kinase 2
MTKIKLTEEDVLLLNSKIGLYTALKYKRFNLKKVLEETKYLNELRSQQEELISLQNWVIKEGKKVVILFEGRDAAGKTGAIRRITEYINPRHFRIVALDIPSDDEKIQWFFQRYINQLPKPGEIVFFDRSWYNRAVVEPVNGFCTRKEYQIFMSQVNKFEKMLIQSDTYLIKMYFSITKTEQSRRFKEIQKSSLKRWKMTKIDEMAQSLWDDYSHYKEKMFKSTNSKHAPWKIIDANLKSTARMDAIVHILKSIPYQ